MKGARLRKLVLKLGLIFFFGGGASNSIAQISWVLVSLISTIFLSDILNDTLH